MFGTSALKQTLETIQKDNKRLSHKLDELQESMDELTEERDELEQEKLELQREIKELKHDAKLQKEELASKKKLAEQEIKSLVKVAEKKRDIELAEEKVKLKEEQHQAIADVKDEYQDKTTQLLEKQLAEFRTMYDAILARLPNLSAKLSGKL